MELKEVLLEYFNNYDNPIIDVHELADKFNLNSKDDFVLLVKTLNFLEDDYIIMRNKKDKYGLLSRFNVIKGEFQLTQNGFGFLIVNDDNKSKYITEDIYIDKRSTMGALNKDIVLVKYQKDPKGFKGEVVEILKRASIDFIGVVKKYHNRCYVESIDDKNKFFVLIKNPNNTVDLNKLQDACIVKVHIYKYFNDVKFNDPIGFGEITNIYEDINSPLMDVKSYLLSKGLSFEFPGIVKEYVLNNIKDEVLDKDYINRVDYRDLPIVTIDGETAKDFDDAIYCEKLDNNRYHLGVYVADVTNYVLENSPLDLEAKERATSVYAPCIVVPMLPFELSNGICSLNPNVDRLVLSVDMIIDCNGKVIESSINKGVIKSVQRLTYHKVQDYIYGLDTDILDEVKPSIDASYELFKILKKKRLDSGALDFETIESDITYDDKYHAIDVKLNERIESEQIIEEFMILANSEVALTMENLGVPFIYRCHEEPDPLKISNFKNIAENMGYTVDTRNTKALSKSLSIIENTEKEKDSSSILSTLMVRSMSKAKYQTNNIGHFGLQIDSYCHFTSPIRRYPDLMVHRLIKNFLLNESNHEDPYSYYLDCLSSIADHSTQNEIRAEHIERDTIDIKKAEYMMKNVGKVFEGRVSGLNGNNVFVMLENTCEIKVPFELLPFDRYFYEENDKILYGKNHTYSLGVKVMVKILRTDHLKGEVIGSIK